MLVQRVPQRLTKRLVDSAKSKSTRYIIWDSGLAGFGLRVEPTGRKTFIARYRARGGRRGILRQATIGRYGVLTPEHARVMARRILGSAADGGDPLEEKRRARNRGITVAKVCDWYLEHAETGRILGRKNRPIKASTLAMDRSRIETHVKPLIGKKAVQDLTVHDVEEMQADIAAGKTAMSQSTKVGGEKENKSRGGIPRGGNGVAGRSLGMLRAIFEHARRKGLIVDNPAKGARKFADQKRKLRLTLEQVKLLGQALREAAAQGENPTGLAVIRFIMLSGFRRHEALTIKREWLIDAGGVDFPDTKTGPQVRPVGRVALDVLRTQPERGDGAWMFPGEGDGHFVGVRKVMERVCKRAGLQDVTPHVLRHTFASIAGDLGYSELTIAGLLGHASRSTTAGYVHLDVALAAAADRVSTVIAAALDGKIDACG